MTGANVTLAIDGDVALDEFAAAVGDLAKLMKSLTEDSAGGGSSGVRWVIDRLDGGSALVTARAEGGDAEIAERAADGFVGIAQAAGAAHPGASRDGYSPAALEAFDRLRSIVSDRVPAVRFENERADATVRYDPDAAGPGVSGARTIALGAVEGLVQAPGNRGGSRFVLYDLVFGGAVSCYLDPGREDMMFDAWGRRAIVEGDIGRSTSDGRPLTIRSVSRISLVDDPPADSYRRARGAVPLRPGAPMPEETIRAIRDAF